MESPSGLASAQCFCLTFTLPSTTTPRPSSTAVHNGHYTARGRHQNILSRQVEMRRLCVPSWLYTVDKTASMGEVCISLAAASSSRLRLVLCKYTVRQPSHCKRQFASFLCDHCIVHTRFSFKPSWARSVLSLEGKTPTVLLNS